MTKSSPII